MCVHPDRRRLLAGAMTPEGNGRSRPPGESPPAGRSREPGGSHGREQKKIGLRWFGPIFLCRGGAAGTAGGLRVRRDRSTKQKPDAQGDGGRSPRALSPRQPSEEHLVAARVRGAAAPAPGGGPHAKPQHTPGRGYGWPGGQEGHPDKGYWICPRIRGAKRWVMSRPDGKARGGKIPGCIRPTSNAASRDGSAPGLRQVFWGRPTVHGPLARGRAGFSPSGPKPTLPTKSGR
jgi:hypothetical protein